MISIPILSDYGMYPDPKFKARKLKKEGNKIAVVITLYVGDNVRSEYPVRREDLEWEEGYTDDKLENLKFTIKCHQHFKAGMDYDLILIDNSTNDTQALEYYKTLPYPIYKRENNGFSFGGYQYAWDKFGDKYDYYLFHEQDFTPCKDSWLKEIYDAFQDPDLGVIGNVVEYRDTDDEAKELVRQQIAVTGTHRNYIYSVDGAWYFTSSKILKQIDKHKARKILDGSIDTSTLNEILFAQPMMELGYKAGSFGNRDFFKTDRIHWYGSRKGSLIRPFDKDKLVPIVDGITRLTCPQMRQYFNEAGL